MPSNLSPTSLPYSDIAFQLLASIHDALYLLSRNSMEGKNVEDKELNACYSWLDEPRKYPSSRGMNPHLTASIMKSKSVTKENLPLRLTAITRQAFLQAQLNIASSDRYKGVYLPSPLRILHDALTVPTELHSRAYSLITCRNILYKLLNIFPASELTERVGCDLFTPQDINDSLSTLRTYLEHGDNYSKGQIRYQKNYDNTKKVNLFLAHFLAMKGIILLRFGTKGKKASANKHGARLDYCQQGDLLGTNIDYEFMQSPDFVMLPSHTELINQIWGIPLPIRGGDILFHGGLLTSSDGSLVMSVCGAPGTGKTSMALAIASALSPMGTSTYCITFEENKADIIARVESLTPQYLKKMSIYRSDVKKWFFVDKIEILPQTESVANLRNQIENQLNQINTALNNLKQRSLKGAIPNICPLVIIIDGVSVLCEHSDHNGHETPYDVLRELVKQCRALKVMVILLSGENNNIFNKLDYLVDTVISLKHEGTADSKKKAVRIFTLTKTRQQISRPGAHVFHLSGDDGFRISPQLPSQLDKQHIITYHLPDEDEIIDTLNIHEDNGILPPKHFLDLYQGSQIILHGHGSSGKAGLALKILMSPTRLKHSSKEKKELIRMMHPRRRILIISFLYPNVYYQNLEKTLNRKLSREYGIKITGLQKPRFEYLSFFPGYLSPEDLIGKIIRQLKYAEIEGEPYTGVLLDGLHNVFLNFPSIQKNTMIWPMIYNVLVRSKVTVVSTFTTFTLASITDNKYEHTDMMLEGSIPFLQALVQATEFYLELEPTNEDRERVYKLTIREAFKQKIPSDSLYWNREHMYFWRKTVEAS